MFKRLFVYILLTTWVFARMDWLPIHNSYLEHGHFPHASVHEWWGQWSFVKDVAGKVICPPCKMLAEPYYFVFFEIEAGLHEQSELLTKHAPYEGILADGFWWGQGGEGNSNPWKFVSWEAWFLYWLPYTVVWWIVVGDLFRGKRPWWLPRRKMIDFGLKKLYEIDVRICRLVDSVKSLVDFVVSTYRCPVCKQAGATYQNGKIVCSCGRETEV